MIEFLAVQVRLSRVTLEQITAKFGQETADQVEALLS